MSETDLPEIEAKVTALAHGGSFVCVPNQTAQTTKKLFVREVIPGEQISARCITEHKNFIYAELLALLENSPHRIQAPCPYFSKCGGCDLQHIEPNFQRRIKLEMVQNALIKQAKLKVKGGIHLIAAELPAFNYRSRITLHLKEDGQLGFFRLGSRDIVEIEKCLLANHALNDVLPSLHQHSRALAEFASLIGLEQEPQGCFVIIYLLENRSFADFSRSAIFRTLDKEFTRLKVFEKKRAVFSKPGGALGYGYFSQVNPEANQVLINSVVQAVSAQEVTELYAGAGNLSLPLARAGKTVTAVEVEAELVQLAQALAERERLSARLHFIQSSAEAFMKKAQVSGCLLLDPPRSGAKDAIAKLKKSSLAQVVYVSCSLPTLARDLRALNELGFALEIVQVLDMFPQTHHVETISILSPH